MYFHNQTVYDQEAVDLFCNTSAHPAPTLQWYKGSSSLEGKIEELNEWVSCNRLVRAFYRVQSDVGRLRICNPQNALHTGYYTCVAANNRGESNATAFLDVLGKIAFKLFFHLCLRVNSRHLSFHLSVGTVVCGLSVCVPGCRYVSLSFCLFVCLSVWLSR